MREVDDVTRLCLASGMLNYQGDWGCQSPCVHSRSLSEQLCALARLSNSRAPCKLSSQLRGISTSLRRSPLRALQLATHLRGQTTNVCEACCADQHLRALLADDTISKPYPAAPLQM